MAALIFPMTMMGQYTIYPVPHTQTAGTGTVSFTNIVNVVCDNGIDEATRNRVKDIFAAHNVTVNFSDAASSTESNVYLGVNGANGQGNAMATQLGLSTVVLTKEGKFDRHILSLTDGGNGTAQLLVLGENTDATFFGLASLEQMLDNGTEGLATVTINDYADLKERGVIEGFYGKPYAGEVRQDLLRFMMRYKMNCYVYGPKSDYYHSGKWSEPYPTKLTDQQKKSGYVSQQDLKDFTSVAHDTKVSVVWAIHPGNSLMYSATAVNDIMKKFTSMYDLGFRQFAIFADDVAVPNDDATMQLTADRVGAIQKAIEAKWNTAGANPADTVKAIRFTPQIYCRGFAGSEDQFNRFFKALSTMPSNVTVYYTGGGVWSVPNNNDLNVVQNRFGRQAIWWWNYPCNDNGSGPSEIYPLDMKSNFIDMPNVSDNSSIADELTASNQGILCNPMEQGEASKTAIFSAGDYSWNNRGFNNLNSWEASFKGLFPGNEAAQQAYRFLAPYLSKNDPASLNTLINNYKSKGDATALNALMDNIVANCDVMTGLEESTVDGERLLYADIKPWVLRLRALASLTKDYLACASSEDIETAWTTYMNSSKGTARLSTASEYMTQHMSGFGESGITLSPRETHASYRYLTPFVSSYLKSNAANNLFTKKEASVFTNVEDLTGSIADNNGAYTLAMLGKKTLPAGGYVGIALPAAMMCTSLEINEEYIDNAQFSTFVSADGQTWQQITETETTLNTPVRYLAVKNVTDANVSVRIRSTHIKLYHAQAAEVQTATVPTSENAGIWSGHEASLMADGNYNTYTCINRTQKVNDDYTIRLTKQTEIKNVRICMGTTNDDYAKKAIVQVSADNKNWTTLKVAGSNTLYYSMSLPQNIVVGTESENGTNIVATDFVPTDANYNVTPITARYVRLRVSEACDKWLRLHEIEVNGSVANSTPFLVDNHNQAIQTATDGNGSTSTAGYALGTTKGGEFIYNLMSAEYVKDLRLFCDPATVGNLKFAVSLDGKNFTDVDAAVSDGGIVTVAFTEEQKQKAKQVKMTWTGRTVPAIYEIVENTDANQRHEIEVTGIKDVTVDATTGASEVKWEGGHLSVQSALGLRSAEAITVDGRTIFAQTLGGTKQASLPIVAFNGQTILVRVTLTDGSVHTYKLVK